MHKFIKKLQEAILEKNNKDIKRIARQITNHYENNESGSFFDYKKQLFLDIYYVEHNKFAQERIIKFCDDNNFYNLFPESSKFPVYIPVHRD